MKIVNGIKLWLCKFKKKQNSFYLILRNPKITVEKKMDNNNDGNKQTKSENINSIIAFHI